MFCLAKCSMTMENCVVGYVENEGNVLRDFFSETKTQYQTVRVIEK